MVGGDIASCHTDADILSAIDSRFSAMADKTMRHFYLSCNATGLKLYPGGWHVTINRADATDGTAIAYSYGFKHSFVFAVSKINGSWGDWIPFAVATPPTWYDLPITSTDIIPIGRGCRYTKDQFGLVTVELEIKSVDEAGVKPPIDIATLPAGYRPGAVYADTFYMSGSGQSAAIYVAEHGPIRIAPLLMGEDHTSILFRNLSCQFSFYSA